MLSIVIPARNLADSIVALIDETLSLMEPAEFEIIVVDDASGDGTAEKVANHTSPRVRLVRHDRAGGAAAAIRSGVEASRFSLVCVLDGDARIPPWHIHDLLRSLQGGGESVGLVAGERDSNVRGSPARKLWTFLRRALLRDASADPACGIRLFRREAYLALPYFENMQLFLAALFGRDGWQVRILEVEYRGLGPKLPPEWSRPGALAALVDLIGVFWLQRRRNRSRRLPGQGE